MWLFSRGRAGWNHQILGSHGAKEVRASKTTEAFGAEQDDIPDNVNQIDFTAKDVPRYLKDLFTNWTFVFLAFYICCDIAILGGMGLYGPKFAEVQFELTAGAAAGLFGVLVVPAGVVGTVMGGLLIDKLNLSIVGIMKAEIFMSVFVILMGGCLLLYCEAAAFAGVDAPYPPSVMDSYNLTVACNAQCTCGNVPYDPVCGPDELQYFSPCHAGCTDMTELDDGAREFYNCSCVAYNSTYDTGPEAVSGVCPSPECNAIAPFAVLIFFAMVGLFMSEAMNISAIFRVVPNTHRLFASMCQSIMLRIFGTVPAPLIFGAIFDASCSLWQDTCGERGSCYFYDKQQLALSMFAICVGYKGCALIFMILAWFFYKPPKPEVIHETDVDNEVKDSELKSPSTVDLNKAFDQEYNTKDKKNTSANGNISKSNGEVAKDLTDKRVNDFFLTSSARNSPVMAGRVMTTSL